jgi:ubiquinone/menaquinone biosynthesis C-methylase UbiE
MVDVFFDGKSIPFPDNSFDLLLCTEVLERALEPLVLIEKMKRVLKIDGLILITAPSMRGEHEIPYDFWRFTSFGIRKISKDLNLDILKLEREQRDFVAY